MADVVDRHVLYEAAVQDPDFDLDFCERIFRKYRNRDLYDIREDFCGTATFACAWVERHQENDAWGVDLHLATLEWGMTHNVMHLEDDEKKRIHLVHGNVLTPREPLVDLVVAFNFSCFIFKNRQRLIQYFRSVLDGLEPDGMFIMDCFGGTGSMDQKRDRRTVEESERPDGLKVPAFTYVWDQASFNAINHDITCYIHFKFADRSKIDKAFTYHWRLWTLPELKELLLEAGFKSADVHLHGWTDDGESDETYRKRTFYENEEGWVGYVVAAK